MSLTRVLFPILAACVFATIAAAQEQRVPVPVGVTSLRDIGIYSVSYQSGGGPVQTMPESWVGHFEEKTGISYVPSEFVAGRPALLLHSPWRVPPGPIWVDYALDLPDVRPITLSFGIVILPDVVARHEGDGATFSCSILSADGAVTELMREHYYAAEWKDFSFDLSAYAGKPVTLRLQAEPGPKNDASFDYSYFGSPEITVGDAQTSQEGVLERLTSSRAYRATHDVPLTRLANDPARGILPGNLLKYQNAVRQEDGAFLLSYVGDDCRLAYSYVPATGTLDDLTVRLDGNPALRPCQGGGLTVAVKADAGERLVPAIGGRATDVERLPAPNQAGGVSGPGVRAEWEYSIEGKPLRVAWQLAIIGKALRITVRCEDPVVSGLSLGQTGGAPLRRTMNVPYLSGTVDYLPVEQAYVCRYLDWTISNASTCPGGTASYEPKTDGTRNSLYEVGYVAVSPSIHEVLPSIPHPASPYRELLAPRVMLDIWGHHGGTYAGDAANLRELKDNGVDHVAIISHDWQRYGYDAKLPDHIPPNPAYGGEEGMAEFGKAANECGYVWSLHENYIDLYPDAPSYDPAARVLRADGSPSPAWFNGGTGVQSFGLKCDRALGYARRNAPWIHEHFGTTAAYLDVHTCVPPWHQLDHEASVPMAAMARSKVQHDRELFQFMRDTHGGPLFGEGYMHFYWAGLCDGVEAQVNGGENHVPLLDFDLLRVHSQMVNHGMGYYERWFQRGYQHELGVDAGTPEQVDKYRAQELAYGHAGFIGNAQTDNIQWVAKEHHLMHPVQGLYGAARVEAIDYEIDGRFVSASVATALGETRRQRVRYESGLTVYVNWMEEPWTIKGRELPQWGFLALGPDTEVWTAMQGGAIADYAACPEYVFVDARTAFTMPYLRKPAAEPKLVQFEYLGGNRIRVTYEWHVSGTIDREYQCFVHFLNKGGGHPDGIVFQQDHPLPKPTSQWRPGDVVTDGPYEITIPDEPYDTYDLVIGLHAGDRLPLTGLQAGGNRVLLARLELTRGGAGISNVRLGDLSQAGEQSAPRADFTAHTNPEGTFVDFGNVATDGSVKVERAPDSLTVFPYPRGRQFDVELDIPELLPGVAVGSVVVRAMAAGTRADMGLVPHEVRGSRIRFTAGGEGVGRYRVGRE